MSLPSNTDEKKGGLSKEALTFIHRELRFFSSHPLYARRKAIWLFRLPALAVALLAIWMIWKGFNLELGRLFDATQGTSVGVLSGLCLMFFLIGLSVTGVLSIRAGVTEGLDGLKQGQVGVSAKPVVVLLLGATLAGGVFYLLPSVVPSGLMSALAIKKYAFLAAFLPYIITLTLFDWFTPGQQRSLLFLFGWVAFLAAASTFFAISAKAEWATHFFASRIIGMVPILGPWMSNLTDALAQGFLRLCALGFTFVAVYFVGEWTLSGIPKFGLKKKKEPQEGVFLRIWKFLLSLVRKVTPASKASSETALTSPWLNQLCESISVALPEHVATEPPKPLRKEDKGDAAPLAPDSNKNILFGGLHPSKDQWDALSIFLKKSVNHRDEEHEDDDSKCPDLLLEGSNGAGKTTTLMAAALQALLVKGERVALFAPDATSRRHMAGALSQWMHGAGLQHLFRVEELSAASKRWLDAPEQFPEIMVTSPQAWEDFFFGDLCNLQNSQTADSDRLEPRQQLQHWIHSVTAFFIDDIASVSWTSQQLALLPFLIDKQRFLLSTSGRGLQLMATTTLLDEVSTAVGPRSPVRDILVRRLFGGNETPELRRHYIMVRQWQAYEPERVEIECKGGQTRIAREVTYHVVRRALWAKNQVIVYLPENDEEKRKELRKRFIKDMLDFWTSKPDAEVKDDLAMQQSLKNLLLVCHVNEVNLFYLLEGRPRVLIYDGALADSLRPQLFSRYGSNDTTVIAVKSRYAEGVFKPMAAPIGYPLLVARESIALVTAHIRSACVHLPVGTPVPRDYLSGLGIRPPGLVPGAPDMVVGGWQPNSDVCFKVDPPDPGGVNARGALETNHIMPVFCYAPDGSEEQSVVISAKRVDPTKLVGFGATNYISTQRNSLLFGELPDPHQDTRLGIWIDESGIRISSVDLAFIDELTAQRGEQKYWCRKIQWDAAGNLIFSGEPYVGLPSQATIPYWNIRLLRNFGSGATDTDGKTDDGQLGVDGPWEGTRPEVQVVELFRTKTSLLMADGRPNMSTIQLPAFSAEVAIVGSMPVESRGRGAGFAQTAKFEFPATVTVLLLDAKLADNKKRWQAISDLLNYDWDTGAVCAGGEFWPELTLALQTGLRSFAHRISQFCRLAVFRLNEGGAAVFFIEPLATAGTIKYLLKTLLDYPELTQRKVCAQAIQALKTLAWSGPGFVNEKPLDIKQAERLISILGTSSPAYIHRANEDVSNDDLHLDVTPLDHAT